MNINVGWWEILTIFLLVFGLLLLVIGIFTAYFGSGKSRAIGGGLLAIGLIIGLVWIYMAGPASGPNLGNIFLKDLIIGSIAIIGAAILGAVAAIGLFLLAIMKS